MKGLIITRNVMVLIILLGSIHCSGVNKHYTNDINSKMFSNTIRRHYMVAFDISGAFVYKLRRTNKLKETLTSLFKNKIPRSLIGENTTSLEMEKKYETPFFDFTKDQISFFHFGIPKKKMNQLFYDKYLSDKIEIIENFKKEFITKKNLNWKKYSIKNNNIDKFIDIMFESIPKSGFGNGVTLSNYVYPLVLDAVHSDLYAEEYILIIVSDFLTGSELGNKEDYLRLRDIYKYYPYKRELSANAAPNVILNYINKLSNAFYPIKYFEYVFRSWQEGLGIIAYKIKPKAGLQRSEDLSIFIDGNVDLKQIRYQGDEYTLSESKLRFTHNDKLKVEDLNLTIEPHVEVENAKNFTYSLFKSSKNAVLRSNDTANEKEEGFEKVSPQYNLKELNDVNLEDTNLGDVTLTYTANTVYTPSSTIGTSIKYAFDTKRYLDAQDIQYKSKLSSNKFQVWLISIIVFLLLVYILIIIAKPKNLSLIIETPLNESFEEINYKKEINGTHHHTGKQLYPYLRWYEEKREQIFVFKGKVGLGNAFFRRLWKDKIYVKILQEKSAPGYEIHLKNEEESIAGNDHALKVDYIKNGSFDFKLEIKKVDTLTKVDKRIKFEFVLEAFYEKSFLFFSKKLTSKPFKYSFYIGPELGNHWVGIDPGTTGSCIAIGADGYEEVFIPKTPYGEDLIIPSMLTFLTGVDQKELRNGEPYKNVKYFYGELAEKNSSREQRAPRTFRSIKKLLGFTDTTRLNFTKLPIVSYDFQGKELCSLLIQGIYKELKETVAKSSKKEFLVDEKFEPKRAVVAIPNNFTAQKTQDIVDSIKSLQQFEEIRCIYEAEANLMYYLFEEKKIVNNTTVLLFDMGGSTINVTVALIKEKVIKNNTIYNIDILGKLGYGIGGDTIDYVIINFLNKYLNELGIYEDAFDFSNDNQKKERLVTLALELKKEIIKNYNEESNLLIDNIKLGSAINSAFKTDVFIGVEDAIMEAFTRKEDRTYAFFESQELQSLLLNNVRTVIEDILTVSQRKIDQVIFSGRSVVFPKIEETVLDILGKSSNPIVYRLAIDKLKSAVAKGACLYGMNRSRIVLNSIKVNSWFAVKHSTTAHDFDLIKLIALGESYTGNSKVKKLHRRQLIESDFGLDGGMVNFYQIMGANPIESLQKREKHKYNLLQQVRVDSMSEGVGIEVCENDDVVCEVKEKGAEKVKHFSTIVGDHEVGDANDEHYTWIIK